MSILDRLNLLVRSNLNDTLSSGGAERRRSAFNEMESSIQEAKRELARVRNGERQIADLMRQERERADKWEDRAMLAMRHGDEDLAKEALRAKRTSINELERLRDQLDGQRQHIRDIERALEALELKLDGARDRVQARHNTGSSYNPPSNNGRDERDWDAEMERRLHQRDQPTRYNEQRRTDSYDGSSGYSPSGRRDLFDTSDALSHIDRMERKVSEIEARIDASQELTGGMSDDELMDPRKVELDRIFKEMEGKKRANDDLSDLKKRFSDD